MPTEERGILIKGPWKRKTKFPQNLVQEVEDDIAFIENLTKGMNRGDKKEIIFNRMD